MAQEFGPNNAPGNAPSNYKGMRVGGSGLSMQPAGALKKLWSGDKRDSDPADHIPGMPPNFGEGVLPHVITFQGIIASVSRVYRPSDEALKDSFENARFMRNDPTLMECIEQRQRSTALLNWHLEPDDPKDATQKWLCEQLTTILEQIPRFMQYRENLLHALWYGRYAVQNRYRWKNLRGQMRLMIDRWLPVHGDKLVFRYDDGTMVYNPDQIGIRVGAGFTTGDTVAKRWNTDRINKVEPTDYGLAYFLEEWERPLLSIHKHMIEDGEYEDPRAAGKIHGLGIRSRIYWLWYQRQETLSFLMEFLERSSTGIEIWYYPWGNAEAEAKTRKAAEERIGNGRSIILVPRPLGQEGMAYGVERIEPGMAGAQALKEVIVEIFGHAIKRYILGQTLTTEATATGLGSNLASVHLDTYLQIVRYDATNLEETMTTEVVDNIKLFNFPKYRSVPVRFVIETESPDVEGKLAAMKQAWDMGAKLPAKDIVDLVGASPIEPGDEVLENPQTQQAKMQMEQARQQQAAAAQQAAAQTPAKRNAVAPGTMTGELWAKLQAQQLGDELAKVGMTSDQYAAGEPKSENAEREKVKDYAAANATEHPRGSDGKFVSKWKLEGKEPPEGEESETETKDEVTSEPYIADVRKAIGAESWSDRASHTIDGLRCEVVNGNEVAVEHDMDFVSGGNDERFGWMPMKTVWIDDRVVEADRKYIVLHEVLERHLMAAGMSYEKAHALCNRHEKKWREEGQAV